MVKISDALLWGSVFENWWKLESPKVIIPAEEDEAFDFKTPIWGAFNDKCSWEKPLIQQMNLRKHSIEKHLNCFV